jgi:hypothetical protein
MRVALLLAWLAGCTADGATAGQHEITQAGELLTTDGRLREPGWSRRQLLHWDVGRVNDPTRLRQWDFFTILAPDAAVNLTLVDLGFAQVCSVGVIDFASGQKHETLDLKEVKGDVFSLSSAVEGSASFTEDGAAGPAMTFTTDSDSSRVEIAIPASLLGEAATGAFTIQRSPTMPYLSLATPFDEDPHFFFYEQKIPGMSADGNVTVGARSWSFAGAGAVMDWGRGEWPSSVTWRWAGASGTVDGVTLAFNLGEGFGDHRAGTENLVVRGDVAHKLGDVAWSHDATDPTRDWTFQSADGRLSLVLHPIAPETGGLELGGKYSRLQKGYGRFSGTIELDDGETVRLDGMLGFAEEEQLAW